MEKERKKKGGKLSKEYFTSCNIIISDYFIILLFYNFTIAVFNTHHVYYFMYGIFYVQQEREFRE